MNIFDATIGRLNRFSDWVETKFPWWLTYNGIGDPISWVFDHPLWTLIGAGIGWLFGYPVYGACAVVGIYIVREIVDSIGYHKRDGWAGAWKRLERNPYTRPSAIQVGWLADSIGDVVGPALTTLLIWWWLT